MDVVEDEDEKYSGGKNDEIEIPEDIVVQIDEVIKKGKIDEKDSIIIESPLTGMLGLFLAKCALLNNISLSKLIFINIKVKEKTKGDKSEDKEEMTPLDGFFYTLYLMQDNFSNNSKETLKSIKTEPEKIPSDFVENKNITTDKKGLLEDTRTSSKKIEGGKRKSRRKNKQTIRKIKKGAKSRKIRNNTKNKRT